MRDFTQTVNTVRYATNHVGRFRGAKLAPCSAQAFEQNESGVINQAVSLKLDPIPGELLTSVVCEVIAVYVPWLAMYKLKHPNDKYASVAEVLRQRLMENQEIFVLEDDNEIAQRCGIEPISIGGVKKVSETLRLAHNASVNYLRIRKHRNAEQLLASSTAITPALISQTVLDRFNAVLDPENRINGAVEFSFPEVTLPVTGFARHQSDNTNPAENVPVVDRDGEDQTFDYAHGGAHAGIWTETDEDGNPTVSAVFKSQTAGQMGLTDFYEAERMDAFVRQMHAMYEQNPEKGFEAIARWAHGLRQNMGDQPFVIYNREFEFGSSMQRAMDGANMDKTQTNVDTGVQFTVPVPPNEFGGVVMTFVSVKPQEVIASQPNPRFTRTLGLKNYLIDEQEREQEEPVIRRQMDSKCPVGNENDILFYVGKNHMERYYVNSGFTRNLDPTTVEHKSAIWQHEIPLSVSPTSIFYPEDVDHYPFADNEAEVCTYHVNTDIRYNTPLMFGSTPLEKLNELDEQNTFGDQS